MALKSIFFACLLSFTLNGLAQEAGFSLIWEKGFAVALRVDASTAHLKVKLQGAERGVAGKVSDNIFTPFVPFTNGLTYVVFSGTDSLFSFTPDLEVFEAPTVVSIFPLAEELPENLLKFYFVFSKPMEIGKVYNHLRLFQEDEEVQRAFIELSPELWNETGDQLTVWIEPGRIKRDLGPNLKLGPVLEAGKTYRLVLDKDFRSRTGKTLEVEFEKRFTVVERDEQIPKIGEVKFKLPGKNTSSSASFLFHEPMDYAISTMSEIYLGDELIVGKWHMPQDDILTFWPAKDWEDGEYSLEISSRAEDLAGNNFIRPFDVDLTKTKELSKHESVSAKFEIR